jgi:hypothetical protein
MLAQIVEDVRPEVEGRFLAEQGPTGTSVV